MANYRRGVYDFTVDSTFTPFTMQEMLVPFSAYKEEYEKEEEAYNQLTEKADAFKYLAKRLESNPDSEAAKIYKGYADELEARAKDLTQNGLSMGNRRALTNLKRRYRGEIGRLVDADNIRKEQLKEQRSLKLQDPTRMFSRQVEFSSLDDYLSNPDIGYDSYSGALLTQQVATAASNIAKELNDYIKTGRLDAYTKTWIEKHGYSAADVAMAIKNPASDRTGILSSLVSDVVNSSGIPQWGDPATTKRAYEYASQGLWAAIGQSQVHTFDDFGSRLAAQEASQKRVAEYAASLQNPQTNHAMLTPRALRSQQEIDDNTSKINTFIKNGYMVEKNGKYVITDLGRKVYANSVEVTEKDLPKWMAPEDRAAALRGLQAGKKQSDFRIFMDKLNGGKPLYDGKGNFNGGKGNFMPNHASNLFTQAVKNNSSEVYDMYHSTEYVRQLDESYGKELKRQVMSEPEVLQSLDFNGKNGFKGKPIKKSDLEKFTPTRINYSRYGNTITWTDDKGGTVRTNAPVQVNERVSNTTQQAMNNAAMNAAILRVGKVPKIGKDGMPIIKDGVIQFSNTPLTNKEKMGYYNDWQNEMDIVQSIGAMYVTPSSTKKNEYGSYEFGVGTQSMFDSEE